MFRIALVGPPCSGKTTLGDELARITKLPHIIASRVLAESAHADSGPLDYSLQLAHVVSRLRCADCANGFILDNFPRTGNQAKDLQLALNGDPRHRNGITHMLDLELPPSELERRAASRLVDPTTNLPVLGTATDAQAEGILDELDEAIVDGQLVMLDGMPLAAECAPPKLLVQLSATPSAECVAVRRDDDAPDRVFQKFQRYAENIGDIREFYENDSDIVSRTIDGTQARREVLLQALELLGVNQDGCAAKLSIEKVPHRYAKGRDLLAQVEDRNWRLVAESLEDVRRQVGNSANWSSSSWGPSGCSCSYTTRKYCGPDPAWLLKECRQSANEITQIRGCLWKFRKEHHKDIHGDKQWYRCAIPGLFAACAKASLEIEELQQQCKDADKERRRVRNLCSQVIASTATQSSSYRCEECSKPYLASEHAGRGS